MKGYLITVLILLVMLTGCTDSEPVETFRVSSCKYTLTGELRRDRRQGACTFYSKIGNNRVCTMHSHYYVKQEQVSINCTAQRWQDVRRV